MEYPATIDWVVMALAIVARGLFVLAEDALAAVGKGRAKELAEAGRPGSRSLSKLKEDPERAAGALRAGAVMAIAIAAAIGARLATRVAPFLIGNFAPAPGTLLAAV